MKIVTMRSALQTSWITVLQNLNSPLASQEICILWNPKVHCHVHISLILSQFNPFCIIALYLRSFSILFFHLCLVLPSSLFPSDFPPTTTYVFIFSPMCLLCIPHLSHQLSFAHRNCMFGEGYKPCSSLIL